MLPKVYFRHWVEADTKSLVSLRNRIADEVGGYKISENEFLDQRGHPGWTPELNLHVAIFNSQVIGECDIWVNEYEDGIRAILSVGVESSWRRRGIGSNLVSRSLTNLPSIINRLDAGVEENAVAFKSFLSTYGFHRSSVTELMRAPLMNLADVLPESFAWLNYDELNSSEVFRVLHNDVFRGVPNWRPITRESMNYYLTREWFDPSKLIFVATESQDVIAWIWLSVEDNESERLVFIESIGVKSEFQGYGIGNALLHKAHIIGTEVKASALELSVDCENVEALKLYVNAGFSKKKRTLWLTGNRTEVEKLIHCKLGLQQINQNE